MNFAEGHTSEKEQTIKLSCVAREGEQQRSIGELWLHPHPHQPFPGCCLHLPSLISVTSGICRAV